MSTYREHYSVSSHDVDINNNIKPSSLARLMQETANHNMRDRRPTYEGSLTMVKASSRRESSTSLSTKFINTMR